MSYPVCAPGGFRVRARADPAPSGESVAGGSQEPAAEQSARGPQVAWAAPHLRARRMKPVSGAETSA